MSIHTLEVRTLYHQSFYYLDLRGNFSIKSIRKAIEKIDIAKNNASIEYHDGVTLHDLVVKTFRGESVLVGWLTLDGQDAYELYIKKVKSSELITKGVRTG